MPHPSPMITEYADALRKNTIHYLPSCVIAEMMTNLYSRIFAIYASGDLSGAVGRILPLLAKTRDNIRATCEAYGGRVAFFVGDWGSDKLRARRQFFNIMSHLGHVAAMAGHDDRDRLYGAIEGLAEEWIALDRTMDGRAKRTGAGTVCRYFRSRNRTTWKQTMANVILTLDEEVEHREGEHLVLICYEKMRRLLLAAIDGIQRRQGRPGRFPAERILAVSGENVPFSCPTCLEMADAPGGRGGDGNYPEELYAEAILRVEGGRRPRPRREAAAAKEPAAEGVRARTGNARDGVLARLRARVQGAR